MAPRAAAALTAPLIGEVAPARVCGCIVWQLIFFYNVFCACVAFSIVMPSLFLYLESMGGSNSFYALVVAGFSAGEAVGSIVLGSISNWMGIKPTLLLCTSLNLVGACLYGLADTAARESSESLGPLLVLAGRLSQGLGSGGQQAVEQAYLAVAARPEQRTALTGKLATFACMGFIFGPTVGAAVSQLPNGSVGIVHLNEFTKVGWVCALLNVSMYLATAFGFSELKRPSIAAQPTEAGSGERNPASAEVSLVGIWAVNAIFLVHFNGFAIQETLTTPLVGEWFGWTEFEANLLFTAAGIANLLCALVMSVLTAPKNAMSVEQRVSDRVLLFASLAVGLVGWLAMVPPGAWGTDDGQTDVASRPMSLSQFGLGFSLVTICFPFGRGLCLAMVGKLLGDQPQGFWMGLMLALGAIARIIGPFWAVHGYYLFGSFVVFGSASLCFVVSMLAMWLLWSKLAPEDEDEEIDFLSPAKPADTHKTPIRRKTPVRRTHSDTPNEPTSFFETQAAMYSSPHFALTSPTY